jgi:hypothetical protein
MIEQQEVDVPRTNPGNDNLQQEFSYPVFTVPNQQQQHRKDSSVEAQQRTGQSGKEDNQFATPEGAYPLEGDSTPIGIPGDPSREEAHMTSQKEAPPTTQVPVSAGNGL